MYTITIFGERVFAHESKDVWLDKCELILKSSWAGAIRYGFEPK